MIKVPELPEATDESEEPNLEWFVLKVQSGREDTIRDGIVRRIKMEALDRYFDQVVVPTEKVVAEVDEKPNATAKENLSAKAVNVTPTSSNTAEKDEKV